MGKRWIPLLAALPLAGCAGMMAAVGGAMPEQLVNHGVAAQAEVLEVWDTGWTVNDDPVVGMRVRVRPVEGPPYEATIDKTLVSRIATWQFQPGTVIPVRYDPQNPALVAVDSEPRAAQAGSGNPYRDRFQRVTQIGVGMLPAPAEPSVYLGTGDSAADQRALYEHNYAMIGASGVEGGADLAQAIDYGKEVGAALVVVYGSFAPPAGTDLEILPFRPQPAGRGSAGYGPSLFSSLGADGRVAAYWGKTRPAILGVVFRPPDAAESANAKGGLVVEAVTEESPAAAAGFTAGDVVVAIDGEPVGDFLGVPALLRSKAGRSVRFDVLRGGNPIALTAELNPAE